MAQDRRLDDGFPTVISFSNQANMGGAPGTSVADFLIWEKRVKPPGISGGGANDTTTMRNNAWRTMNAKRLRTLTEMTCTVSYDPKLYDGTVTDDGVLSALQDNQEITIYFPDGSALNFMGFLDEFNPSEVTEGSQPEAEIKIIPTNTGYNGEEVEPTYEANAWNGWQPGGVY